jgi:hypothetical protein
LDGEEEMSTRIVRKLASNCLPTSEYPGFPQLAIKMPLQQAETFIYASIQQDVSFLARRAILYRQGCALPDLFRYTQFS